MRRMVLGTIGFALLSGCATERAALSSGVSRSYTLDAIDAETALAHAVVTARGLGYSVNEYRGERRFYAQRGSGVGEFTSLEARVTPNSSGGVKIEVVAKSSAGGDATIDEFMAALRKSIATK